MVFDSTPTRMPRSRSPSHSGRTRVGVGVRLPEPPVCREREVVPVVGGVDPGLREDGGDRGALVRVPPSLPGALLGLVDAQREGVGLGEVLGGHLRGVEGQAVHLSGVDPPLLGQVHLVPRRQRAAPVEDDGVDGLVALAHAPAPRTAATTASTTPSTGTSVRSPDARSLTSTLPSASPRPTTTMVGTPISSESLNFTPGLTPLRSSNMTVRPCASRSFAISAPLTKTSSSFPVATRCTSAGETSRGQTSPSSSWFPSAMAATARETPTPSEPIVTVTSLPF